MTKAISTAPHGLGMHVRRPSEASAAAKAAKEERKREFKDRMKRALAPAHKVPMSNATMTGSYCTGDGEVVQQPRQGSQQAFALPSRGDKT